jgi:single-strand DNA-binding protein
MAGGTTRKGRAREGTQPDGPPIEHCNEVRVVGRLAAAVELRSMPSGDAMVAFRIVVDRPPDATPKGARRTVDALECVGWRGDVRRSVSTWVAGDVVEVSGALRRRFWRGAQGASSRTEIEVRRARRLSRRRAESTS